MNPKLVQTVLYPLQEKLLRRPTFDVLGMLEATQWYPPARLRELQAAKLNRLLTTIRRRFPTLARTIPDGLAYAGLTCPHELLRHLPLTDRDTILRLADPREFRGESFRMKRMTTGGSTGQPLAFHVNPMREAYDKASRMRTHRWFGVEPGDREIYLWGAPIASVRQDRFRSLRDRLLNDRLISAFDLSPDSVRRYVQQIAAFDPTCIFGYPSSIANLCRIAREANLQPTTRSLKAVFVTGEVLDEQQRYAIEDFFQVSVADGYGGRDFGFCAHQCPEGTMHVMSEHVVLEIVDEHGSPLPVGESGQIAITNLDNDATPFIRYRTGDIGRLIETNCPCGRGLETMAVVAGRQTDHLVANDGSLRHALSIIYALREMPNVAGFQVHQREDRSVVVRIVTGSQVRSGDKTRVEQAVHDCLGESIPTTVRIVDRIDAQASGKFRYVISEAGTQASSAVQAIDASIALAAV
jgi:phenylacetate-coenzyme A ligase PaaK-like adenylate-forming protein